MNIALISILSDCYNRSMQKKFSIYQIDFLEIDSTNTYAKKHYQEFPLHTITCVTAKKQSAGRGRMEKRWESPEGNVYATFCFHTTKTDLLIHFGQLLAISTIRALHKLGIKAKIKWPNDIMIDEKKVGGILAETTSTGENEWMVFAGLGLNIIMDEKILNNLDQPATSLQKEMKKKFEVQEILSAVLENFIHDLHVLEKAGFLSFVGFYNDNLSMKGKEVICTHDNEKIQGLCLGITEDGTLKIQQKNGNIASVVSGHLRSAGN